MKKSIGMASRHSLWDPMARFARDRNQKMKESQSNDGRLSQYPQSHTVLAGKLDAAKRQTSV